jgi:ubiquinone/menaquinone biosynthesis C-methylase UbiE
MSFNALVKNQFNKQAAHFDAWSTPKNSEYLKGFSEFCGVSKDDSLLLDVACGTGDFAVYCAPFVKKAIGIDISDKMIELSRKKQHDLMAGNVSFQVGDVGHLPFGDYAFSLVTCKSAIHHMPQYRQVFSEMVRCCEPGGRVALCDIAAYDDPAIDCFFETFEKLVDRSHARTVSKRDFNRLFLENGLTIVRTFELEIQYTVGDYRSHAAQSEQDLLDLAGHLKSASSIKGIIDFLDATSGEMEKTSFKRKVYLVLGTRN